jgi:hypothetical protein
MHVCVSISEEGSMEECLLKLAGLLLCFAEMDGILGLSSYRIVDYILYEDAMWRKVLRFIKG